MSGDKTPVKSAILNRFDFVPKIVELANYKKNINIKANDVNLISMARNTDFCFKTTYISVFFCASDRSYVAFIECFVIGSSPFGKVVSPWTPPPPTPRKLLPLNHSPPPWNF